MPTEAEWLTRKSRIDNRLKQKGWRLVRFTPAINLKALDGTAVEELPTANGPADYALFLKGQLLGIIEAKKVTVNPQNVLEQAKRYAAGVPPRLSFLRLKEGEQIGKKSSLSLSRKKR
jgi:type I restriction enzyme, R subunit